MKNKKIVIGLSAFLVVLIAVFGIIFITNRPETQEGKKNIGVTIVYADKSQKELDINTDAEFLADALYEKELLTEEEYKAGFYTQIDGVIADYNADKAWWCVMKDGEMTSVGMNELAISDGDKYEIIYQIG